MLRFHLFYTSGLLKATDNRVYLSGVESNTSVWTITETTAAATLYDDIYCPQTMYTKHFTDPLTQ